MSQSSRYTPDARPDGERGNVYGGGAERQKAFPIEVVLSISSGILACKFSDMQEGIEWIAGHPVWTHELADREFVRSLQEAIAKTHPQLSPYTERMNLAANDLPAIETVLSEASAAIGTHLIVPQGSGQRREDPVESAERLFPGKPVIAVRP